MKKIKLYLSSLILFVSLSTTAENLNIGGLEFPTISCKDWVFDESEIKYTRFPIEYNLKFYLSDDGWIDSLEYDPRDSSGYIEPLINSLENIEFTPGMYLTKGIPMILPARLEFITKRYKPRAELLLPEDFNNNLRNRDLITETLELNDFSPASIEKIPSYFCYIKGAVDYEEYQYAIYKIKLDSSGQVKDVETLYSNYKHYSDMFSNILLYADYRAAKFHGRGIESNIYVVVRFFYRISYPTEVWPSDYEEELDYSYEYHRISVRPYLDSIINPPFPENMPGGKINYEQNVLFNDTLQVAVTIDTLGNIKFSKYYTKYVSLADKICKSILKKLKYLPARDIKGNKVRFDGQLTLILTYNSKNIRIISNWLQD